MSWIADAANDNPTQNGSGPGFTRYTTEQFDRLRRQHNIMVFVGNGFDIQTLHDYKHPIDSRYETFYHYLKMRRFDPNNALFKLMESELILQQQEGGHGNWSDIEAAISGSLEKPAYDAVKIFTDLRAIQAEFAGFLQGVAPSSLLDRLGVDAEKNKSGLNSLSEFLADIADPVDFKSMQFPAGVDHHNLFNFQFVNFNYTTLLDDYVYLGQGQFDPLMHNSVDTHFLFKKDPRSHWEPGAIPDKGYSGYVVNNVIHPHGVLSTPRSLLFGVDAEDNYKQTRGDTQRLTKPYWCQAHALYRNHFSQADLFVIFGCSLGDSDGWWWRNIVRGLRTTKRQRCLEDHPSTPGKVVEEVSELIIYRRQDTSLHTVDSIKDRFLAAAEVSTSDPDRDAIADRIRVVIYDDTTPRTFLNTRLEDESAGTSPAGK